MGFFSWLRPRPEHDEIVPSPEEHDARRGPPVRGLATDPPGAAGALSSLDRAEPTLTVRETPARAASPAPPPVPDAPAIPVLDRPERYDDQGLLGRGGMGAVRLARDRVLGREVAVKLLDPALGARPSWTQSFVEEAQITAQLDHPNIVPVHELGTDRNGATYFTMKCVRGHTLRHVLNDPSFPPGSSERLAVGLEIFVKTCDAMAFAHSRGILHRDIKPDNVMVGSFGEVYLMDWGLAKVMNDRPGAISVARDPESPLAKAREGLVGTPAYMPPEMANRQFDAIDERSDVFGLGAVLYHIVTGDSPYAGDTVEAVLARARACDFAAPSSRADVLVSPRLAMVVMKAMARQREDRYASVDELSTQVREFIHRGLYLPRRSFPAGAVIVREGEIARDAYIVTRGRCEVYRTVSGERQVLRTLGPGTLFGEAALVESFTRIATVEATTDVTVLVLTRETLEEGLGANTWEGLLAKTLLERFRELDAKLTRVE